MVFATDRMYHVEATGIFMSLAIFRVRLGRGRARALNVLAELRGETVFNLAASLNVDGYEKLFPYAEALGAKFVA